MSQPTPPAAEAPPKRARPPAETAPPGSDAVAPQPAEEGAIFHALLDAGVDPRVAYTAEKRLHTMISEAIAPQLQPLVREMSRRFDEVDRRFDGIDRRLDGIDHRLDGIDGRLNEHDRRLAVLAAQMRLVFGALGLLVTVLIAVFGFLFANAN